MARGRWFRFYEETLNNPKAQALDPAIFKGWVNLLAIASMHNGDLPPIHNVAFLLRMSDDDALQLVNTLVHADMIDRLDDGTLRPHDWEEHQYKSIDRTSTERSRRQRQREREAKGKKPNGDARDDRPSRPATTVSGTPSEQSRTETEAEADDEKPLHPAAALLDIFGVKLTSDPKYLNWPGEIFKWCQSGGKVSDLLTAGHRVKERGETEVKPIRYYFKVAADIAEERKAEENERSQLEFKNLVAWLKVYAHDGRWHIDCGPAPHEEGTRVTNQMLELVPGARRMLQRKIEDGG